MPTTHAQTHRDCNPHLYYPDGVYNNRDRAQEVEARERQHAKNVSMKLLMIIVTASILAIPFASRHMM